MRAAVFEAVAPETACIPLCIIAGTIVTAFGLGWFFGSTWYSSRTASSSLPGVVSEKRAVSITGSVGSSVPAPATPTSRGVSTYPADARKAALSAAHLSPLVPTTALDGQQATTSLATSGSQGELKSGPRLTPAPETRPATIDGWTVREVYGGAAVLIGTDRVWTVRPGDYVPGVGRIEFDHSLGQPLDRGNHRRLDLDTVAPLALQCRSQSRGRIAISADQLDGSDR